jgi:uncharacterized protein (DUF2249 family)
MNNSATPSSDSLHLDVREIPPRTKHATIFRVWAALPVGSHFVLVNDHDPLPLYYQFSAEYPGAFDWEYLTRGPDLFQVKITRLQPTEGPTPTPPVPTARAETTATPANGATEIDARGLEPPEPLIRILDALESLSAGAMLRAITDREPCHLFGEAEQRGFQHESHEQPDGSWVTVLARG